MKKPRKVEDDEWGDPLELLRPGDIPRVPEKENWGYGLNKIFKRKKSRRRSQEEEIMEDEGWDGILF